MGFFTTSLSSMRLWLYRFLEHPKIFPAKRHKALGKDSGKTSYIERFNNTMRQRIALLGRKFISFSKKLSNHIGAILYFIHHKNASLQEVAKTSSNS
jgi:insertion element IS1 protein InsB